MQEIHGGISSAVVSTLMLHSLSGRDCTSGPDDHPEICQTLTKPGCIRWTLNALFTFGGLRSPARHSADSPLFEVMAGDDRLADSAVTQQQLQRINSDLVTAYVYPDNYHENLNETNREEIYEQILAWQSKLNAAPGP